MIVQSGIKTVVYGKKKPKFNADSQRGAEEIEGVGDEETEEEGEEEDEPFSEKVSAKEIFYWAKVATL